MDLVYLCKSIPTGNHELRFSLRSAERNLHFDKVFIVGYKPEFLNDKVIHIPMPDVDKNKHINVARKIAEILCDKRISDDFILMNDDFYILREYKKIPYYYNKSIREWTWRAREKDMQSFHGMKWAAIVEDLYEHFPDGKFFETHFPMVYNKQMLTDVIRKYKLRETATIRSHYCNEYKDKIEIEESKDYKIHDIDALRKLQEYKDFISTTNITANHPLFKSFIKSRFTKSSSYEIINK